MPISIGPWEIVLILVIVLLIFGPSRLPQLARALGDAIKQFRGASLDQPQSKALGQDTDAGRLLVETAAKLGIDTRGKTLEQIAAEIAEKQKQ